MACRLRSLLVFLGFAFALSGCHVAGTRGGEDASAPGSGGSSTGAGAGGSGGAVVLDAGGSGSGGAPVPPACNPTCSDFPPDAIVVGVGAAIPGMFGPAGTGMAGAGPCVLDPQDGTLFPSNWLRPRIRFQPGLGQTAFEIRVHSDQQKNDLVVYTDQTSWAMPKDVWGKLVTHQGGDPVTVTVRSLAMAAGGATTVAVSAPVAFRIAPVTVGGSIVYWTTSGVPSLKGFHVGDEAVTPVMTPNMVGPTVQCIGCHVSTPDGQFIGMAANLAIMNADPAALAIRSGTTMMEPPFLTAAARQLIGRPYQPLSAFSAAHWKDHDHVALSMLQNMNIIWTDLEAASMDQDVGWGIIARNGDTGTPVCPAWSHDGQSIVYTSATGITDTGVRIQTGVGTLYTVPYNDRKGGDAKPLPGGGVPGFHAYYPAFSPDDQLIAFTRAPSTGTNYDVPEAEIFVMPRDGTPMPTRLLANDPPQCANRVSPGVTNSWPKWAPTVGTANGTVYRWLTFSSRRNAGGLPQIFVTAITVDAAGAVKTYPALHLWNQPETESNHTPAWDDFKIVVQ
ncbi:MAG TPA: hypothetical protein VMU50_03010 [Polyangia bacterium]|nr:hypothetical protein [Polyangia bacterium]